MIKQVPFYKSSSKSLSPEIARRWLHALHQNIFLFGSASLFFWPPLPRVPWCLFLIPTIFASSLSRQPSKLTYRRQVDEIFSLYFTARPWSSYGLEQLTSKSVKMFHSSPYRLPANDIIRLSLLFFLELLTCNNIFVSDVAGRRIHLMLLFCQAKYCRILAICRQLDCLCQEVMNWKGWPRCGRFGLRYCLVSFFGGNLAGWSPKRTVIHDAITGFPKRAFHRK